VSDVFADTHYWIAIINPHDQLHSRAVTVSQSLGTVQLVTTDDVLVEVLNFFAGYGALMRSNAAQAMHSILQNANVEMLSVERDDFSSGLTLYESRLEHRHERDARKGHHPSFEPRQALRPGRLHHLALIGEHLSRAGESLQNEIPCNTVYPPRTTSTESQQDSKPALFC